MNTVDHEKIDRALGNYNQGNVDQDIHLHRYITIPGIWWAVRDRDRKYVRDFNNRPEINNKRSKAEKHKFFHSGKLALGDLEAFQLWISTFGYGVYLIDEVEK